MLWDPAYANRVCWRDNPEDSVRFAALALGQNPDQPEVSLLLGDCTKARQKLDWHYDLSFEDLVCEMVDADLAYQGQSSR